jgi:hypothetical protein
VLRDKAAKTKVKEHLPWGGLENVFSFLRFYDVNLLFTRKKALWRPRKGISQNSGDEQ